MTTTTTEKMTKRDYFNEIIEILEDCERQDLIDVMKHEIELLDKKSESAKAAAAKKKAVADGLSDAILAVLTDEPMLLADLATAVAETNPDATAAKCQYRLNKLVESGDVAKAQISVPGVDGGKPRKLMAYSKVIAD
jgi:hypothetical protein